jgi:NAD(P)-dependent dehydrogenase (short-subunit alcohol dehydrogenase family)
VAYPGIAGKVAIVTGAAGGIGKALVAAFVKQGLRAAALDIDENGVRALEDKYGDVNVLGLRIDVSDPDDCHRQVAAIAERLGTVHILVNNAAPGMNAVADDYDDEHLQIEDVPDDLWRRFFAVNVNGAFFMARSVVPIFRKQKWEIHIVRQIGHRDLDHSRFERRNMVLSHERHRLSFQHGLSLLRLTAGKHHLDVCGVVRRQATEPAAAHEEFRILRDLMIGYRNNGSVGMLLVNCCAARLLLGCLDEICMIYSERIEQVLAQVVAQRLAADFFDQLPNPVDADAVFPPIAWLGQQRLVERAPLAVNEIGKVIFFQITEDDAVAQLYPKPAVCVSNWRGVIGRLAGLSFGAPSASKPSSTCTDESSDRMLLAGSSSLRRPCSMSCMAPAATSAFVIEAYQNIVSSVMGSLRPTPLVPAAP